MRTGKIARWAKIELASQTALSSPGKITCKMAASIFIPNDSAAGNGDGDAEGSHISRLVVAVG